MQTLFPALILSSLCAAYCSAGEFPWCDSVPADVARDALTPDTVFDEKRGNWRPTVEAIFKPLVRDCRTAREAVLTIAANMTKATGVIYSPERRHPCMSALEALEEKKVSCTGQSILLICALRSVGIPARAVGILRWNHVPGNHTWVEAWFDGEWHMIEFNEQDFNTPWVMDAVSMIDPQRPEQRIYATTAAPTGKYFPTVWNRENRIPAVDVTDRYIRLAREYCQRNGQSPDTQKLMIDLQPRPKQAPVVELVDEKGQVLAEAPLPCATDDMRRMTILNLPRDGQFTLRLKEQPQLSVPVRATENAVRILRLRLNEADDEAER